ncbi:MAG TPA: DUF72 domain-containing protein [Longimicrobiales bacterium]
MSDLRVGISGWTYAGWRGVFYPPDITQKRELEYASRQLNSIEINGTFYSLQRASSFQTWYDATPPRFQFALKGSRFITHMKKLKEVDIALANFFASGVLLLREKLGPILWQFPPQLAFNEEKFAGFLELLPRTTTEAARLARKHDDRLKGRAVLKADKERTLRHAFEVRHESFLDERFVELLRKHRVALVFADTAGLWPYAEDVTADFIYIRLHGASELYTSGYSDDELDHWAARIKSWSAGRQPRAAALITTSPPPRRAQRDVYVYFDNDRKVRAPFDALRLAERLSPKRQRKTA